jgi:hypothetical protein
MSSPDPVPDFLAGCGWPLPTEAERHAARRAVDQCLADVERASVALARFYDPTGRYAGMTFLDLQPAPDHDVTAADLLAVTLLDVSIRPPSVRRLLHPGPARDQVLAALAECSSECDLTTDDATVLVAAAGLYQAVKQAIGINPWVIASKLCARKRPDLIPMRDNVVVKTLQLRNKNFRSDWLVYRYLLRDAGTVAALQQAARMASRTPGAPDLTDLSALRLLDSLLWMTRPPGSSDPDAGSD